MNILHIMKDYKPNVGGSVVRNGSMIDAYHRFCADDKIYVLNLDGNRFVSCSEEDGVVVFRAKSLREMFHLARSIIRQKKIDIVQTHNYRFLMIGYYARLLACRKVGLAVELHAVYKVKKIKELFSNYLLRRTDLITVLSKGAKDYLVNQKHLERDKIEVLRNGMTNQEIGTKHSSFTEMVREKHMHYTTVAYLGSFYDWQGVVFLAKNYEVLAESFPSLMLLMIGDGEEFANVEKIVKDTKFPDRIVLHKNIAKEEVCAMMNDIDIIVIPRKKTLSTDTAIPLKVVEAMIKGKCILASKDEGIMELLNESNSCLFEPEDVDSLSFELKKIIDNKQLRIKLGDNAKKHAETVLSSWESNAIRLHELYQSIRRVRT